MSEKELLYLEDALNHIKLLKKKCENYADQVQNSDLKLFVKQLEVKHQDMFNQLFSLL